MFMHLSMRFRTYLVPLQFPPFLVSLVREVGSEMRTPSDGIRAK